MTETLLDSLKKNFGYDSFRPLQEEIVQTILKKKDVLVLMPTGGGKSICFQLPALQMNGLTLVISPLISLMQDQVESLKRNGISAEFYNSSQNESQKELIRKKIEANEIHLLYVAPETLFNDSDSFLINQKFELVVIDEAHCASMWGHDFRPEYQMIHKFRNRIPEVPFAAFTATADKITRKDISEHLGLKNPKLFLSSFDRPNIYLNIKGNLPKKDKWMEIASYVERKKSLSGIIYCLSRKETEELADYLKKQGHSVAAYHAGMPTDKRAKVQQQFLTDDLQIICATIAFGMGIDKSNVRFVIHNNLPKNLEGYYQEIGRAGRDGEPAEALLYYSMKDVKLLSDFAQESSQKDLLIEKLNRILAFCETNSCRRKILLNYFSENYAEQCNHCDACDNPVGLMPATIIAQMALSAAKRCNELLTNHQLIDVLRGAKTNEVYTNQWDKVKTYGVGAQYSWKEWNHFLKELKNLGVFEIAYDQNMHLKITAFGVLILEGREQISISKMTLEKVKREIEITELNENELLFDRLRILRKKIAVEENIPPFYIFSDATLRDMSLKMPTSKEEFLTVSGVGEAKLARYSEEFIGLIFSFLKKQSVPQKKAKTSKKKGSTYDETFELFQNGRTIEQIGEIRGLSETTVLSHIGELILTGRIEDYIGFLSPNELEIIESTYNNLNQPQALKPIYEELNGEINYGKIRIALSVLQRRAQLVKS